MVFVPAVSTFYISQKLGSTSTTMIGDVIETQFKSAYNPNLGAAMSLVLMVIIFVCIGLFVVIPTFGPFGVLWTLLAAGITIASFYRAFGKRYTGPEIHIEDEECGKPEDVQERLETLRALYEQKLIAPEEYERKRQEILKDL